MAKYCPECNIEVGGDDKVCGTCGYVLEKKTNADQVFSGGVFKEENVSKDFVSKGYISDESVSDESVSDESSSKEIVADEIIADGIVDEEKYSRKSAADEIYTGGDFKEENTSKEFASTEIVADEAGSDEAYAREIVADEIIANGIVDEEVPVTSTRSGNVTPQKQPVNEKAPIRAENTAKVLSLGDWMITLLLLFIPIVNIVMLIIWSVDSNTNENKKHFAWAYLIYMAIGLVVGIIFSSILVSIILASIGSMY